MALAVTRRCCGLVLRFKRPTCPVDLAGQCRFSSTTTQPVQFVPRQLTEEHVRKIGEVDEKMRQAYDRIPDAFPAHSQPDSAPLDREQAFRKRLLYRSKQRGWLEVDLLLGAWADAHLAAMNSDELREYEKIMNAETIDIYNYVTGKDAPPAHLEGPIMQKLIAFAKSSPLGRADPAAYAKVKKIFSN